MKKIILLSCFGLLGTFALANQTNKPSNEELLFKVESVNGICTVYIYGSDGTIVSMSMSVQPSEAACSAWAAGKYWDYVMSLPPLMD